VRASPTQRVDTAVICAPGLEQVCAQELRVLGLRPRPAGPGTLSVSASTRQLYAANVWLRTASRVLVRLATFRATDFPRLQQGAADIDWDPWLPKGKAPSFRVTTNESKLYHTDAIAQRLHQIVGPPSLGEPEQGFVVRIDRNTVTISADASGEALYRRPWRTELGTAPLRPTMAAALLLATGWDPATSLIDPFCGVGTIPIEAALLARNLPPGGRRSYAFQDWPCFEPGTWASVGGEVATAERAAAERAGTGSAARLHASDRNADAVAAAQANAERAGVADDIEVATRVVSHLPARPGPGLVATNPPYGRRVGEGRLDRLYQRFGAVVAERLAGWDLAVVAADRRLVARVDRNLRPVLDFRHGGLAVKVYHRPAVSRAG
jgi:putative N6-adenine-specific DNA methylase